MFRIILTFALLLGLLGGAVAGLPTASAQPDEPEDTSSAVRSTQPQAYTGFVTGPRADQPVDIALDYVRTHTAELGLTPGDTADVIVSDVYTSESNGVTHVYLAQRYLGIEVTNGLVNINVMSDGRILYVGNRFTPNLAKNINTTQPDLTAPQAVQAAADQLGLQLTEPLGVLESIGGPDRSVVLSDGGISQQSIPVRLVYAPQNTGEIKLAWNVNIYQLDSQHWWDSQIDALTGKIVSQSDWVVNEDFDQYSGGAALTDRAVADRPADRVNAPTTPDQYRVYPWPVESPIHTTPLPPSDGRTLAVNPAQATASPFGWHDTNGVAGAEFTTTEGNNASAYTDVDANNLPDAGSSPSGGVSLDFDFPITLTAAPSTYRPAAVTNLFYWNNLMHDVPYLYGFTEAAGNFQLNTYGHGGLGNDPVNAEAQDGVGTNNANFATPADGSRPRMQMFIWTTTSPNRDGDVDNGIIAHEYAHGISNRLTGGPSNVSCLQNDEQMGEGWSDWYTLFMTMKSGDTGPQGRGIGTYALGQPTTGLGIRPARYSTDMNVNGFTYANIITLAVPHGVGFAWNTMLWEMNWGLIDAHGFNSNIYGAWNTGGNNLANQLIMDGMKIQPCSPGFVDGRNAILAADQALTGGANQCIIWKAFAKRGLGFSASQGSSASRSDGTQAFDLPATCLTVGVVPAEQNICRGQTAQYTVSVGALFTPPVALSATGNPPPTSVSFTPNPVTVVPTNTLMTVSNTGSAATGSYTLTVSGTDGITTTSATALLRLFDLPSGAPALTGPANGAVDVALRPTFTWAAQPDATSYGLEVATDLAFTNVVYTATVNGTSHAASSNLQAQTQYYWRVTSRNVCGSGSPSAAFSFTTALVVCATPNASITDNNTISTTLNIVNPGTLLDLNVSISGTHTWVGDLTFTLTHSSGTAAFIDRPGVPATTSGCNSNNFDPTVDDEGVDGAVENQCRASPTALFGNPTPNNPLSVFDGLSLDGNWSLQVRDSAGGDTGVLQQWCLIPSVIQPAITLTKTVGTDPAVCATGNTLNVPYGSEVTYCYTVNNTGSITTTLHTLEDDQLGTLFNNFSYALAPGASLFITQSATLTQTTVNTAQWLAGNGVYTATATAQATVTVSAPPAITLEKTVGTDPAACASGNTLSVPYGSAVYYCYTATNTGSITTTLHTLEDNQLGTLLNNFSYALVPGASLFITRSATLTQTTVNTAQWLAGNGIYTATATSQATVTVSAPPTIGILPVGLLSAQKINNQLNQTLTVSNTGGANLQWNVTEHAGPSCASPVGLTWLSVSPLSGTISPANQTPLQITFDSTGLTAGSTYTGTLCLTSNDPTSPQVTVPLTLQILQIKIYLPLTLR